MGDHESAHQGLQAFSSLGACGAHAGNQERDLHRWLCDLLPLETYSVSVPLQDRGSKHLFILYLYMHFCTKYISCYSKRGFCLSVQVNGCNSNAEPTSIRVLLPHEVIAALFSSCTYFFESVMLGHFPDEQRVAFWEHVSKLDPWKLHPIINQGNFHRLIGLHIHGDGVEFYKEDEYFIWSWSSVFGSEGSIKDVLMGRFPIAVMPERWMRKTDVPYLNLFDLISFLVLTMKQD